MLDEEHHDFPQEANYPNLYTPGRISEHNIIIAWLPAGQIGTNSAATVASQMKFKFPSIQYVLMVGIGGGVPSARDIRLGDVVVSQPHMGCGGVVQYDFGKNTPNGFVRTGFLNAPPTILLSALLKIQANHVAHRIKLSKTLSEFSNLRDNVGPISCSSRPTNMLEDLNVTGAAKIDWWTGRGESARRPWFTMAR